MCKVVEWFRIDIVSYWLVEGEFEFDDVVAFVICNIEVLLDVIIGGEGIG